MARDGRGIHAVVLASPLARSFSSQAEQPLSTQQALERVFAACARQPSCRDVFPNVEQDFYAAYDDLTSSPVSVPILRPDSGRDTVWLDGSASSTTPAVACSIGHAPRSPVSHFCCTSCAPVTACAPPAKS
jgi:hypothetical protein